MINSFVVALIARDTNWTMIDALQFLLVMLGCLGRSNQIVIMIVLIQSVEFNPTIDD